MSRWTRGIAVLGALGALGASGAFTACASRDPGVADMDQLLLADVAEVTEASVAAAADTADAALGRALLTAASTALRQWSGVRPYPRARLPFVYRLMGRDGDEGTLSYDVAREVAERDHVRWVLGLWLARGDQGWRVTARLTDVRLHREVAASESPTVQRAALVGALGDALDGVRRVLGGRGGAIDIGRAEAGPLPRVTTASLEALRSYDAGSRAWRAGDYARARDLWLRAVDLDSAFSMALGALGSYYFYNHERAPGERYYAAALAHSERLTDYERLRLRAQRAAYRGETDTAIALSGAIARRYPSAAAWYDYGTGLMRADRDEAALAALRQAVVLDSSLVNAWINIATTYKGMGRFDDAVRAYARADAVDSTVLYRGNVNTEYGGALVHLGRMAQAESAFRRMTESARVADRALALRSLGYLAVWDGRLDEAADAFRRAAEAAAQIPSPLGEGRSRLLLAGAYRLAGRLPEADSQITRVLALARDPTFEPVMLALIAYDCGRQGRSAAVDTVLALLRPRVNPANRADVAAAALAEATSQLERRRPDDALAALQRTGGFPFFVPPRMLAAAALEASGRPDSARAVLRDVIERRPFGSEGQDDALRAPLLLGDLLLQVGDTTGAARQYRAVLTQWRSAPRDFPDLAAARAKLAELTGR
ncbi:hypothetical protein J421_0920 [Gemmatirosa kalamazoonensis]|uniref:Tetratricopeptide repeat protein n=1 Tax=Gemmatirosa kalamazoonensis TaxID=861299 RepID=W0RDD8_9BACT|nr:tetratricopeptide repeat protein [Gemmatirosa kalamazoonensis]AHG88457.1 hypothetical protein J421_0920 [Gemmatirosa kalamazoonensis]